MTSLTTDKHNLSSSCTTSNNSSSFFMADPPLLSFQCSNPGNMVFNQCNNINNNGNRNNNVSNNDPSNLLAFTVLNQALNFLPHNNVENQININSLQFPEMQKMVERSYQCNLLSSEYLRLKSKVDQSGLLSPKESLVTTHRGRCFWSSCTFQSDIEDNFKKHMNECHQLTSSAIAQVEISLEKSLQLSTLLLTEQNHLYNMLLHLDQKYKCLPGESSPVPDYHHLAMLLNKFKQSPNMMDLLSDQKRVLNNMSPVQATPAPPSTIHPSIHAQYHPSINKPQPTLSQQLMDNLSSTLLRQQPVQIQAQNTNYPQTSFPTSQSTQPSFSLKTHVPPMIKSENSTCNYIATNNLVSPPGDDRSIQINNGDNNPKETLPTQSTSTDSNYPRSDSTTSNHIKDKKVRGLRRTSPDDSSQKLSMNISDREYYRQYAMRPSASYVNLIKTAILESPRRELSLNEIYVWMQSEFSYFRDKEQKWKNAIRHNLSLHKCFQRKHGKLWTFDEMEYNLKKSRNRFQYNVPINESEGANMDGDEFDDDEEEDHPEDTDNSIGVIKKELQYNDENMPDNMVPDTDEWSNYLHKTSLKTTGPSTLDMAMVPNLRDARCPGTVSSDN